MPVSQGSGGVGIAGANLKAWVRITGAGAVVASFNVSGVVRPGAGSYQVTFASAMSGANYVLKAHLGPSANADETWGKLVPSSTAAVAEVRLVSAASGGDSYTDMPCVLEFYE